MINLTRVEQAIIYFSIPEKYCNEFILSKRNELLHAFPVEEAIFEAIDYKVHLHLINELSNSMALQEPLLTKALDTWKAIYKLYDQFISYDLQQYNKSTTLLKFFNLKEFCSLEYSQFRYFNDLDLLLAKKDAFNLRDELVNHNNFLTGYIEKDSRVFISRAVDKTAEDEHYELEEITKLFPLESLGISINDKEIEQLISLKLPICFWQNKPHIDMVMDIHHNISHDLSSDTIHKNYSKGHHLSKNLYTFKAEDYIWYNLLKTYYGIHSENTSTPKKFLKNIIDFHILLSENNNINWKEVLKKVYEFSVLDPFFHTMSLISTLFNNQLAKELSDFVYEDKNRVSSINKNYGCLSFKLFNKKENATKIIFE